MWLYAIMFYPYCSIHWYCNSGSNLFCILLPDIDKQIEEFTKQMDLLRPRLDFTSAMKPNASVSHALFIESSY